MKIVKYNERFIFGDNHQVHFDCTILVLVCPSECGKKKRGKCNQIVARELNILLEIQV